MSHGLTEKELASLSPEEREAIESEYSEDELKTHGAGAKPGDAEDDGEDAVAAIEALNAADAAKVATADAAKTAAVVEAAKTAEGATATAATAATPAAGAEGAAAEGASATPGEREPFAVPFHHAPTIKSEDAKVALDGLQKRYDDGEITLSDFLAKRDEVTAAVIKDRVASEISETSKTQMAQALWNRSVEEFLDSNQAYRKDDILYDALNERVKRLAADEANANLSDRQLLSRAHDEIKSRFKVGDEKVVVAADPKKVLADARKPDLTGVPRTLAGVPAASDNQTADDEFAEIERLATTNPAEHERALAKLSSAQQDRYLRGVAA